MIQRLSSKSYGRMIYFVDADKNASFLTQNSDGISQPILSLSLSLSLSFEVEISNVKDYSICTNYTLRR